MNGLTGFLHFDTDGFFKGKRIMVRSVGEYLDFETRKHLGTKLSCVFVEDHTEYAPRKDGREVSNLFEKISIKVNKDVNPPIGSIIELQGATSTVYGSYNENLSVKCDDIKVVGTATSVATIKEKV